MPRADACRDGPSQSADGGNRCRLRAADAADPREHDRFRGGRLGAGGPRVQPAGAAAGPARVVAAQDRRAQTRPTDRRERGHAAPRIKIGIETTDKNVIVKILDNGPGLPQTIKDQLFKPFHTTKAKGHGLGLALSKDLASKIEGDLVYIPTDTGCEFNLILKRAL